MRNFEKDMSGCFRVGAGPPDLSLRAKHTQHESLSSYVTRKIGHVCRPVLLAASPSTVFAHPQESFNNK